MYGLRALRESKGLSMEDVAKAVGVSRIAVLKWEKGMSVPNSRYIQKLAQVLDCPLEDVLSLLV